MSIKALQDYTYVAKYARWDKSSKRRETWNEAVERVKKMHLKKYQDKPETHERIEWAFEQVRQKRVLGSQRALQFGGIPIEKKNARIYNCLRKTTQFITSQGVRTFKDFNHNDETIVLTHTGNWKKAVVKCYGRDTLHQIKIQRGKAEHNVWATRDHRWFLNNGEVTNCIKEGDQLMFAPNILLDFEYENSTPAERLYWAYGYIYGNGTLLKDGNGKYRWSQARLCGEDGQYLNRFEELGFGSSQSLSLEGDTMVYTGKYLKSLPDPEKDDPALIRAFVRGYLDADGTKNKNRWRSDYISPTVFNTIQVTGEEGIEFVRKAFPIAGVYIVSEEDLTGQETNYGVREEATIRFRIVNGFGRTAASFTVNSIGETVVEDVWCLEVEDDASFVLPCGLVTGNCTVSFCDRVRFFQECFWLLLCGSGTGFSVQKHHVAKLPDFHPPNTAKSNRTHAIPDTIEGWADALGILLATYMPHPEFSEWKNCNVIFDFSLIRPKGAPLGSGVGKAPGPKPLIRALDIIKSLLDRCLKDGQTRLRPIDAYDIIMHASDAVLSGGVRRSATICLFSPDDEEMATAKTGNWFNENPQRARSNNSALLIRDETTFEQFKTLMGHVKEFGEPGFVWADSTELCVNPCCEIGFWPVDVETGESGWQSCNLCEINGKKCNTEEKFAIAAEAGAIIGTLQAGYTDFEYLGPVSERIVRRESLLGVSITGIQDNPEILLDPKLQRKMAKLVVKTNEEFAAQLGIPTAARCTCVKPAGTTSCILGTASGIHPHHATRYFRRIQGNELEAPFQHFKKCNERAVEKSVWSANGTDGVITFLVEVPKGTKTKNDLPALELLALVKETQQNWVSYGKVDERCTAPWLAHNVSNTINVKPDEWDDVTAFIYKNRRYFAGISLLPMSGDLDYPQAPAVAIHDHRQISSIYGPGSMFASGLIVDGLRAFNDDLWKACSITLNPDILEEPIEIDISSNGNGVTLRIDKHAENVRQREEYAAKKDWIRRAVQFAERYFEGDIRKMTYCLKEVHNWKLWNDLQREYENVDYTTLIEDSDETKITETVACAGGACEII